MNDDYGDLFLEYGLTDKILDSFWKFWKRERFFQSRSARKLNFISEKLDFLTRARSQYAISHTSIFSSF